MAELESDLEHQAKRRAYWRAEANRLAGEKMRLETENAIHRQNIETAARMNQRLEEALLEIVDFGDRQSVLIARLALRSEEPPE